MIKIKVIENRRDINNFFLNNGVFQNKKYKKKNKRRKVIIKKKSNIGKYLRINGDSL